MAKKTRARLVLCAEITADGKLCEDPPATLEERNAGTHRYEFFFREASAIFSCDQYGQPASLLLAPSVRSILNVKLRQPSPEPKLALWRREMRALLAWLWAECPGNAVCFGGPELFRTLLENGLVDEIKLVVLPLVDGRRGVASLSGPPGAGFFPASVAGRLLTLEVQGDVCLLHYRVLRRRPARQAAAF